MTELLTTRKLIEMLKQQDPVGDRVLVFRIEDERDGGIIASGDVHANLINAVKKDSYDTQDGDKDVICLNMPLDVND